MTNLDRPKFDKGDRVRAKAGLVTGYCPSIFVDGGTIITIEHPMYGSVVFTAPDGMTAPFPEDGFELYAKAGEFVVGDRVVANETSKAVRVSHVIAGGRLILMDGGFMIGTRSSSECRLATPEEIAAAEAVTAFLRHGASIVLPEPQEIGPEGLTGRGGSLPPDGESWVKRSGAHILTMSGEIPAAEFDFSTIKRGDEILVRVRVTWDGIPLGIITTETADPDDGPRRFYPHEVVAVIPAPKPKTLRERAIEAGWKAFNTSKVDDGPEAAVRDLVDAVLAEVEKER